MAERVGTTKRFALAYVVLGTMLVIGVATFVVLVQRPPPKHVPWSAWRPTADTTSDQAQQIANHIAETYRLPSGHRLVNVVVRWPNVGEGAPVGAVAIATGAQDYRLYDASKSVMYVLCGERKKDCAITEGAPSQARGAVLRREAVELALFTLKYIDDSDSVVVFFPPPSGQQPQYALFFRRGDLDNALDHPLRRTLPSRTPPLPGQLTMAERTTVDDLTDRRAFRFAFNQTQQGNVLVLTPLLG